MTRCLIVDGSAVVRKVAKRILTTPTDVVTEAESGSSGLSAFASETPDVVIVDGDLSDMEVTDFIRHIRAMRDVRQPTVFVMMTEMNLALMTKAKRAGADDYMLKPFDRDQLTRRLHDFKHAA